MVATSLSSPERIQSASWRPTFTFSRASLPTPLPAIDPRLLRLDPYRSLDIRLTKTLVVGAGRRIEVLIEAYNLTNDVNYNPVVVIRNMNSAQFLARTAARDARQLQWGARIVF